jgi:hypothetical protein
MRATTSPGWRCSTINGTGRPSPQRGCDHSNRCAHDCLQQGIRDVGTLRVQPYAPPCDERRGSRSETDRVAVDQASYTSPGRLYPTICVLSVRTTDQSIAEEPWMTRARQ